METMVARCSSERLSMGVVPAPELQPGNTRGAAKSAANRKEQNASSGNPISHNWDTVESSRTGAECDERKRNLKASDGLDPERQFLCGLFDNPSSEECLLSRPSGVVCVRLNESGDAALCRAKAERRGDAARYRNMLYRGDR
ncbi:hypothetical protein EYF80_035230 [Liparis tanakae]|uniref:Uncharacterized protein n=1 Tax=Liparis tanakae TaxID=230148 RepID=A0A4Z2GLV1_9TELE|nr:hypothetical protein EYF80_035230 [Liparis tanakae]